MRKECFISHVGEFREGIRTIILVEEVLEKIWFASTYLANIFILSFILVIFPELSVNWFDGFFLIMYACVKVLLKETGSQGVLASIVSWVTSSSNASPVLWDIKVR